PPYNVPHNYASGSLEIARCWNTLGQHAKAEAILLPMAKNMQEYIDWYLSMPDDILLRDEEECMYYFYQLHSVIELLQQAESKQTGEYIGVLNSRNDLFKRRILGDAAMNMVPPTPEEVEEAVETEEAEEEA
ncbi:MAG: hypothetical protein HUK03_05905, partial [Bacteroidaceae bacterium]|nr:hypothetical protein [Bacteroidaceae bacterium]